MINQTPIRIFYGDIHGCYEELILLYDLINKKYPNAEHWHLGDLIDRGEDSGRVIDFVMKNFKGGVMGNHEETMIDIITRSQSYQYVPENKEKKTTMEQITSERLEYLKSLPPLHVFDDVKLIIVHGGLVPNTPLHLQNSKLCVRAQMVKDNSSQNHNRWWGHDATRQPKIGKTEEQSYAEGYRRWYEVYDFDYDCIFGHSVMGIKPFVYQKEGYGKIIGIDTGSCFGGYLTAYIYPLMEYEQIKCNERVKGRNIKNFLLEVKP